MASDHYQRLKCKIWPTAAEQCDKHSADLLFSGFVCGFRIYERTWGVCVTRSTKLAGDEALSSNPLYFITRGRCIPFQVPSEYFHCKLYYRRIPVRLWCGLRLLDGYYYAGQRTIGYVWEASVEKNCHREQQDGVWNDRVELVKLSLLHYFWPRARLQKLFLSRQWSCPAAKWNC